MKSGYQIMDEAFAMPGQNLSRRIWLYLPLDYFSSQKKYAVLYMLDGQNVFDPKTSFSGAWEVDKTLVELEKQGDSGIIVVAIDNGGPLRTDEYSPWPNPKVGAGGKGDVFVQFIVQSLKPYIDKHYRTRPGLKSTGIMGSSLGGLLAFYAGIKYPYIFGKVGVLSPSFWLNEELWDFAQKAKKGKTSRFYFLAGEQESSTLVGEVQKMHKILIESGLPTINVTTVIRKDGQHSEWFWAREFGEAYQWLFGDRRSATINVSNWKIKIGPNPVHNSLGISTDVPFMLQILNAKGEPVLTRFLPPVCSVNVSKLAKGIYQLNLHSGERSFGMELEKL